MLRKALPRTMSRILLGTAVLALAIASVGPLADAVAPDDCVAATNGQVLVTIGAIFGHPVSFLPPCVVIDSGEQVKWTNGDAFRHDPADSASEGSSACFGSEVQFPGNPGGINSGQSFTVTFSYNGATHDLTSTYPNSQGQSVTYNCNNQASARTNEEAVLPYWCNIHNNMLGTIYVNAA